MRAGDAPWYNGSPFDPTHVPLEQMVQKAIHARTNDGNDLGLS